MQENVQFIVLGHVAVKVNGSAVRLPRAQTRGVLALLALNAGHLMSGDAIIEALWGGAPPASARAQVQISISTIRRHLSAAGVSATIDGGRAGYRLTAGPHQIDASRLDRAVTAARSAATGDSGAARRELRAAMAMWQGTPLADASGFFVEGARARLTETYLLATEQLAELELRLGGHANLVPELMSLVGAHPLRESLRARLMTALYRSGRKAEALDTFRQYRRALATREGLDPGRELAALELAVLRDDPILTKEVIL